jgi:hypothetical protein
VDDEGWALLERGFLSGVDRDRERLRYGDMGYLRNLWSYLMRSWVQEEILWMRGWGLAWLEGSLLLWSRPIRDPSACLSFGQVSLGCCEGLEDYMNAWVRRPMGFWPHRLPNPEEDALDVMRAEALGLRLYPHGRRPLGGLEGIEAWEGFWRLFWEYGALWAKDLGCSWGAWEARTWPMWPSSYDEGRAMLQRVGTECFHLRRKMRGLGGVLLQNIRDYARKAAEPLGPEVEEYWEAAFLWYHPQQKKDLKAWRQYCLEHKIHPTALEAEERPWFVSRAFCASLARHRWRHSVPLNDDVALRLQRLREVWLCGVGS